MSEEKKTITSMLDEKRVFPPPNEFSKKAYIKSMDEYKALYKKSEDDLEGFWAEQAEMIHWFKKWDSVLEWQPPKAKWFSGGMTNIAYNCLDRHLENGRADKTAIVWQAEALDESKT